MLDSIFEVLSTIGDFFASIGGFIVSFFSDLVSFVKNLGSIGSQVSDFMSGFPAYFVTGTLALIVIMVLLRLLGRD